MIAGHEEITSGEVYIGDVKVKRVAGPTKRNTAMMFQKLRPISPQNRMAEH